MAPHFNWTSERKQTFVKMLMKFVAENGRLPVATSADACDANALVDAAFFQSVLQEFGTSSVGSLLEAMNTWKKEVFKPKRKTLWNKLTPCGQVLTCVHELLRYQETPEVQQFLTDRAAALRRDDWSHLLTPDIIFMCIHVLCDLTTPRPDASADQGNAPDEEPPKRSRTRLSTNQQKSATRADQGTAPVEGSSRDSRDQPSTVEQVLNPDTAEQSDPSNPSVEELAERVKTTRIDSPKEQRKPKKK